MRRILLIIFSFLSCASPSESRHENDKGEFYAKIQKSNLGVVIADRDEQSLSTSTDVPEKRVNISSVYDTLTQDIQETNANVTYPVNAIHLKRVQKLLKGKIEVATRDPVRITSIPEKETDHTRDENGRKFSNSPRISDSTAITKLVEGEMEGKRNEKNELAREQEYLNVSLKNTYVRNNISRLLTDAKIITPSGVKFLQEQSNDVQANEHSNISGIFPTRESRFNEKSNENLIRITMFAETQNATLNSADLGIGDRTAESRVRQEENWEPEEDDLIEAANFGLRAMHYLYYIHEPKLYSMGLYLGNDDPARFVAAFNGQSEEARNLAKFGYAALQGTSMFIKKFPSNSLELPLSRNNRDNRRTPLEQRCPRRGTPQCPPASLKYRTSDGSCNNLENLWWGSAMSTMQRFLPAVYHDGVQSVRRSRNGGTLPSAREITSVIHEDKDVPLASVTHILMQWGQFVDHDLTATGQSRGFNGTVPQCCLPGGVGFQPPEFMHPECLPIAVNLQDSFYGPLGVRCLEFLRSGPAPKEGCGFGIREQLSQVTSYLDASMVYSSNALHSDSLRIFRNGLLRYGRIQSRRSPLPKHEPDFCKRGSLSTTCFPAGDGRLSEQPALTSLHIVFLRFHNRIATELSVFNPHWSDEKVFQETRRIVGAVVQHITYREFLPIVLGPQVMKIFDLEVLKKGYYEEYDPTVNPTVANAFSTAAYRFGHSLVQRSFVRFDSSHRPLFNNVSIHDEFSNPVNLDTAGSVDRLLLGLVNQPCQRRDEFITEEMTNHLFQTPGFAFGMDLASLNIQRGRDHGLPSYVRWRETCGLSPIKNFDDLDRIMSPSTVRKFKSLYSSVEDIDLFPAGLAEKSVIGGLVGPTFACIIAQQFSNLRRGDRFWYENPESESSFTAGQLQQIRQVTLAQVLCRTMDSIETIQPFVFLAVDTLKNQRFSCEDPTVGHLNLEFWLERLPELKHNTDDMRQEPMIGVDSTPVSRSKEENVNSKRKINIQEQAKITPEKLFKTSIHQNNRVVVKRPFGRPDNVTVVVQNNAVNSPVFVNDGIYNSHVRIQQRPITKPISNFNQDINNYPVHQPQMKPIPVTVPHSASYHSSHPYVPHAFDDSKIRKDNPNPLIYGYSSPTTFAQDSVIYDTYSATSPRPTLYTYYTNFQQKSTTQMPNREVDDYGSFHQHDSLLPHSYEKPTPPVNSGHPYESNDKQKLGQKPNYSGPKPSTNTQSISTTNYASYNQSYHKHEPNYNGIKPLTILRPNIRPNYESYGEQSNYNRPKPTFPIDSRPNDELYHTQKPVYSGSISLTNSRLDPKPNYQPFAIQKPSNVGNPDLQNINYLNNRSNEGYSTHLYKPQHQGQWDLNDYQKEPSKRPYDYDDPDSYQKRTSVRQDGLYPSSGTSNLSYYQRDTSPNNSSSAHAQGSIANHNNHNSNPDATLIKKGPISSQDNGINLSSYVKDSNTRAPQSDTFGLHSLPPHQKPINQFIYQKNDQSQLSPYLKESVDSPILTVTNQYEQNDRYKNFTNISGSNYQLSSTSQPDPSPISSWPDISTVDLQIHRKEENFSSKPMKTQSVTVVTETIETVHQPDHTGHISQHKITSEIPRPLAQRTKNNMPLIRKPGQYYYEKNVLHQYPNRMAEYIPKSNHYPSNVSEETPVQNRETLPEKITARTSIIDDSITNSKIMRSNEDESTIMPTHVITDYYNNGDDVIDNVKGAFSANIKNIPPADVPDRTNRWMNPQEDLNLPSMLEMPEIPYDEFESAKELPKPIKLRSHAT